MGASPNKIDRDRLRSRSDTFFMNHQINLHTTVMGTALAVGGLALASLLGTARLYQHNYLLLWFLWLASMIACFDVYNSVFTSAIALPSIVPTPLDLLPPLLIGTSEFLLFGVLAHQATGLTRTSSVIEAWFFSFSAFCLCSLLGLWRADYVFESGIGSGAYDSEVEVAVKTVQKILRQDMWTVIGLAAAGFGVGLALALATVPSFVLYILALAIIVALSAAARGHSKRARTLARVIAVEPGAG